MKMNYNQYTNKVQHEECEQKKYGLFFDEKICRNV